MPEEILPFDPAEYLDDPEMIEIFLNDAFETNNPQYIAKAFSIVTKAKGMTNVITETGLTRHRNQK